MREHVRKHKEKYKNIILLLIIAFILGWLFSTYYSKKTVYEEIKINQEEVNSYVDDVYRNMNTNLYEAIEEKDFVSFAINSIEKKCPFYIPDGSTYRGCLYDWADELRAKSLPEQVDEVHNYCSLITEKYTDSNSLEGHEIFAKCVIFKLQ